jgi:hypothetical protein
MTSVSDFLLYEWQVNVEYVYVPLARQTGRVGLTGTLYAVICLTSESPYYTDLVFAVDSLFCVIGKDF